MFFLYFPYPYSGGRVIGAKLGVALCRERGSTGDSMYDLAHAGQMIHHCVICLSTEFMFFGIISSSQVRATPGDFQRTRPADSIPWPGNAVFFRLSGARDHQGHTPMLGYQQEHNQ